MTTDVKAIVLTQHDYKESDVLLQVLSESHGKLTLLARGMRKMASKQAMLCQPFMHTAFQIDYHEERPIHVLIGGERLDAFRSIQEDLHKQAYAICMCECSGYISSVDESNDEYQELLRALQALESTQLSSMLFALYLAKLCHRFGIEPYVDSCVICGNEQGICAVSTEDGGFVCQECIEPGIERRSVTFLRLFRLLMKADYIHIDKLEACKDEVQPLIAFLLAFLREHTAFQPRSAAYIQELRYL